MPATTPEQPNKQPELVDNKVTETLQNAVQTESPVSSEQLSNFSGQGASDAIADKIFGKTEIGSSKSDTALASSDSVKSSDPIVAKAQERSAQIEKMSTLDEVETARAEEEINIAALEERINAVQTESELAEPKLVADYVSQRAASA